MRVFATFLGASMLATAANAAPVFQAQNIFVTNVGGVAEIPAIDGPRNRIFVVNPTFGQEVRIYDTIGGAQIGAVNPAAATGFVGGQANSVAISGNQLAIAIENPNRQAAGKVALYDLTNLAAAPRVFDVGALPDQLTFSRDGRRIFVANEGEPSSYNQPNSVDPEGTVSVIDLFTNTNTLLRFDGFNGQQAALQASGVRIFGPNATVAQDLEPEAVAVSRDGLTAYVTLQENNAVAIIDLSSGNPVVSAVRPLGFKNYGPGNPGIDPSDQDGIAGNFQNRAGLYGIYQPDGIATFTAAGNTYFVTANEGDAREYVGFLGGAGTSSEERRASAQLPGTAAPFGRLNVTRTLGATGPAGADLLTFGGRSFSIRDAQGTLLFDSGNFLDRFVATNLTSLFDDGRSDNKGVEPETVTVGRVNGRTVLFVGLERTVNSGVVLAFDLSDFNPLAPDAPFLGAITLPGLIGPEGLSFVQDGTTGLLAVAGEVSGALALVRVSFVPAPEMAALFGLGLAGLIAARRRKA